MHTEYITSYICYIFLAVKKLLKNIKKISVSLVCKTWYRLSLEILETRNNFIHFELHLCEIILLLVVLIVLNRGGSNLCLGL
jgi:hypothetical protein